MIEGSWGHELATVVGWSLLHSLWQGTLVALLAVSAVRALRRAGPARRYRVVTGALVVFALLAPCTTLYQAGALWMAGGHSSPEADIISSGLTVLLPAMEGSGDRLLRHLSTLGSNIAFYATWVWLASICALSLWFLGGLRVLYRLRGREGRGGVRSAVGGVEVVESPLVGSPCTVGWRRPTIILPASATPNLSREQLDAVVAHELAHVRRGDFLVNLLQLGVVILYFFHPAAWWLFRQIQLEREFCCDDRAVELCGSKVTYCRALLRLEETRPAGLLALSSLGSSLSTRMERLARGEPECDPPRRTALRAVVSTVVILVLGGSAAPGMLDLSISSIRLASGGQGMGATEAGASSASRAREPGRYTVRAHDPAGAFTMTIEQMQVVEATIADSFVPPHRLVQIRDRVTFLDRHGTPSFEVRILPTGGITWDPRMPEADPLPNGL